MVPYAVDRVNQHYPDLPLKEINDRLRYATFVNLERRYMYYAVPKAGCTTIKTLIHKLEQLPPIPPLSGNFWEVRREMFIHNRGMFRMKSLMDCSDDEQEQVLTDPDFFRFTVVRNPYTRLQSSWKDKVRPCAPGYEYLYHKIKKRLPDGSDPESLITFDEFVTEVESENLALCNRHWRMQAGHALLDVANFSEIGRIEKLDDTLRLFMEKAGYAKAPELSDLNHSGQSETPYSEALAERVYKLYETDFESFGYTKESWRPPGGEIPAPRLPSPSEMRRLSEIIERNLIIGELYQERETYRTVKKPQALRQFRTMDFEQIFKTILLPIDGWLDQDALQFLYQQACAVKSGCVVEIGSYRGRSTAALAIGSATGGGVPVYAIEPHEPAAGSFGAEYGPLDRGFFMQCMLKLGLFHIVRLLNISSEFLGDTWPLPVKLLWVDGDSSYAAKKRDLDIWWNKLADDAVIVINTRLGAEQQKLIAALQAEHKIRSIEYAGNLAVLRR